MSGTVLLGVTINLTGAATANTTTTTNASGNYSFSGLANGSYTVVPSLAGNTFNPSSSPVSVIGANITGKNFTETANAAATSSLSGTVSGAVAQNVVITLSGANTGSAVTDASGNYSFSGLANGNYTVTPTKTGYTFSPISSAVSVSGADVPGKNFTATANAAATYSLSGTVSGVVSQNVRITLNGANIGSTVTDASGNYSFSGLVSGNYTVTPFFAGYTFSPTGSTITISTVNSTSNNFISAVAPSGSSLVFAPVSAASLPQATTGITYTNSVVANTSGGSPPYHYQSDSFATGTPPIGMIVDLNGNLTGTPSIVGTYTFGVCAIDSVGASSCGTTTISVVSITTFSGSVSGSGSFSRVFTFPGGSTTCTFSDSFAQTITLTKTTQANGTTSSSTHVLSNLVSTATSGSTPTFTCTSSSINWDHTLQASGTLPSIAWTDTFVTSVGTITGNFNGNLSGNSITGTQVETMDTMAGSASIPITLTKQ